MMLGSVSCTHFSSSAERAPSSTPSEFNKQINLTDVQSNIAALSSFKNVLAGQVTPSFAEVSAGLDQIIGSVEQSEVETKFVKDSLDYFGVQEIGEPFNRPVPEYFSVLGRYVDPQSDADLPGGKAIWEVVNKKLRDGVRLTKHEASFATDLSKTIDFLPTIKAIVFRGMSLAKQDFLNYKTKNIVPFPAFTSTSINPGVARGFSGFNDPPRTDGRYSVILIAETTVGAGISPFIPQNGGEYEVLIPTGIKFKYVYSVIDEANKRAFLFMQALPR